MVVRCCSAVVIPVTACCSGTLGLGSGITPLVSRLQRHGSFHVLTMVGDPALDLQVGMVWVVSKKSVVTMGLVVRQAFDWGEGSGQRRSDVGSRDDAYYGDRGHLTNKYSVVNVQQPSISNNMHQPIQWIISSTPKIPQYEHVFSKQFCC